jgi:hypothetical protein
MKNLKVLEVANGYIIIDRTKINYPNGSRSSLDEYVCVDIKDVSKVIAQLLADKVPDRVKKLETK